MTDRRASYLSAARSFVTQVAALPVDSLDGPGLGDWDLRALVGHTSRSLVTMETYLDQPAGSEEVTSAAAYDRRIAEAGGANTPEIAERGRQAGTALGDDPAASVRGPKHVVKRGKTPVLTVKEARDLLDSIPLKIGPEPKVGEPDKRPPSLIGQIH